MDPHGYADDRPGNKSVAYVGQTQLKDIRKTLPLRVLSPADWDHWCRCGYVIVERAVPPANIDRLIDLLWEFQEMDRNDPATWNRPQLRDNEMKEINNAGMIELYNHQYLWDNRQNRRTPISLSRQEFFLGAIVKASCAVLISMWWISSMPFASGQPMPPSLIRLAAAAAFLLEHTIERKRWNRGNHI